MTVFSEGSYDCVVIAAPRRSSSFRRDAWRAEVSIDAKREVISALTSLTRSLEVQICFLAFVRAHQRITPAHRETPGFTRREG